MQASGDDALPSVLDAPASRENAALLAGKQRLRFRRGARAVADRPHRHTGCGLFAAVA